MGVGRGQAGWWLRWFAHPLGVAVDRGHVQSPTFVPAPSKVAIGFFWSLYLLDPEFAQLCMHAIIFSPI